MANSERIAIEADPDDPEDFDVTKTARVDREAFDRFKARGPGWQSRMNEALREAVRL